MPGQSQTRHPSLASPAAEAVPRAQRPALVSDAHHAPVVIDALAARFGGAAYAAVQVAHHLADEPALGEVRLVTRAGSLVARGVRPRPGLRVIELPAAGRAELARRLTWEATGLPRLTSSGAAAVLTWSGMLPRAVGAPVFCYLANPIVFQNSGAAQAVRRWAAHRTASAATEVMVPTRAMGELARQTLGRDYRVVPLGIDHDRFRPAPGLGDEVLCVGDFYVHKRHDLVLAAWAALPAPRPTLRLVGNPAVDADRATALARALDEHRRFGTVVHQSGLALPELVAAYQRARLVVNASERESFSMPLLEAQACGVPAVVRELPALRETGGVGTRYVDSDDPADWTDAMSELLLDDRRALVARKLGLANAARYSWARTAQALSERILSA